ncbi:MAG: hypothetical protein AAF433_07410 [Bacteroidota bacterium]
MTTRFFLLLASGMLLASLHGQAQEGSRPLFGGASIKLYPAFHFQIGQYHTNFHLPPGTEISNKDLAEIEALSPEIGLGFNYEIGQQSRWFINLETQFSLVTLRQLYVEYEIFGIDPLNHWAAEVYKEELSSQRLHIGWRLGLEKHLGPFVLGLGLGQDYRLFSSQNNSFSLREESLVFNHVYVPDGMDPQSVMQLDEPLLQRTIDSGPVTSARSQETYRKRPWTYWSWRLLYFVRPSIGFRLGGNHFFANASSDWLSLESKIYLGFVKAF